MNPEGSDSSNNYYSDKTISIQRGRFWNILELSVIVLSKSDLESTNVKSALRRGEGNYNSFNNIIII